MAEAKKKATKKGMDAAEMKAFQQKGFSAPAGYPGATKE